MKTRLGIMQEAAEVLAAWAGLSPYCPKLRAAIAELKSRRGNE